MDARDPVWWGNLLMIFIESTTVLLLLASYFYCWRNEPQWPPPLANQPAFHQPLPSFKASTANLIVMLGTCITMYLTDKAARQMRALLFDSSYGQNAHAIMRYGFADLGPGELFITVLSGHVIYPAVHSGKEQLWHIQKTVPDRSVRPPRCSRAVLTRAFRSVRRGRNRRSPKGATETRKSL